MTPETKQILWNAYKDAEDKAGKKEITDAVFHKISLCLAAEFVVADDVVSALKILIPIPWGEYLKILPDQLKEDGLFLVSCELMVQEMRRRGYMTVPSDQGSGVTGFFQTSGVALA